MKDVQDVKDVKKTRNTFFNMGKGNRARGIKIF